MSRPIRFGFSLPIFAAPGSRLFRTPKLPALDPSLALRLGVLADTLGFDSLWVADHLMLGKDDAILEGWTTLSVLAGLTHRAKLGLIHQAHQLRHPALSAKMMATLDQLSGGRLIYFADHGRNQSEHVAYGISWSESSEERIGRMLEGLEVTRTLWQAEERISYRGRYYSLRGARVAPRPRQTPHPPIWLGEMEPLVISAAAEWADGWNSTPVSWDELERRLAVLNAACHRARRDDASIEKSLELQVLIARDQSCLSQTLRDIGFGVEKPWGGSGRSPLIGKESDMSVPDTAGDLQQGIFGTPDQVRRQLHRLVEMGISHFLLWFLDVPGEEGMRLFMEQVAPAFGP